MGAPLPIEAALSGRVSLGEQLVAAGAISREQLNVTLSQERQLASQGRSVRLEELLVRNRFTTQAQIREVLESGRVGAEAEGTEMLLAPAVCARFQVIPVSAANGTLTVKSARALRGPEVEALLKASTVRATHLKVLCADRHEMHAFISRQMAHDSFTAMLERLRSSDHSAALVRTAIEALLHEAIDMRVSDIHMDLKPEPDAWISLRIDGELQQSYLLTERLMANLCSRIKTLAGMDGSNSRSAQDGRLELDHRGRMVGFRVATQPLMDGETLTIRVIDAASLPTTQTLFPHQPEMLKLLGGISNSHGKSGGMMLVTGPTGSGKTTTLYTMGSMFPREKFNLITVEDPVEYRLPFARQIQLQHLLGQVATDVERSILRQDPDVLIFGEIRDAESAKAALKFAESGHFVLSTLHSQSAGTTTERMLSMIPESERSEAAYVMAATLKGIINQRLFKRLCECSREHTTAEFSELVAASKDIERVLGRPLPRSARKHMGCYRCRGSGYRDRVAVHETMVFAGNENHRDSLAKTLASRSPVKALVSSGAVRMIAQSDVVHTLLSCGIMDVPTAHVALNVGEHVAEQELALVEDGQ